MTTDTKNVHMTLSMPPALEAKLARLAVASGSTETDVLIKAIALYKVTLQAELQGWGLTVFDGKNIVNEITGVSPLPTTS